MKDVFVQVRFKEQTPYGEYCDALYFTQEEFDTLTEEDIQQRKDLRVQNYIDLMNTPVVVEAESAKDIENELLKIEESISQLAIFKTALSKRLIEVKGK